MIIKGDDNFIEFLKGYLIHLSPYHGYDDIDAVVDWVFYSLNFCNVDPPYDDLYIKRFRYSPPDIKMVLSKSKVSIEVFKINVDLYAIYKNDSKGTKRDLHN